MSNLVTMFVLSFAAGNVSADVVEQFADKTITYTGGRYEREVFHYRLLTPAAIEAGKTYPVVLFLHGAGERGTDNVSQLKYFPELMAQPAQREKYPCYLIAPQCRPDCKWSEVDWSSAKSKLPEQPSDQLLAALAMLDEVLRTYPTDRDRVYLTGLSMGGYGAWDAATRWPERFAALAAICGGGDEALAGRLVDLPIWVVHGEADNVVPVARSRNMIAAIERAGGHPKYTELPGVGHNSWTPAYNDPQGIVPWMFQQRRRGN